MQNKINSLEQHLFKLVYDNQEIMNNRMKRIEDELFAKVKEVNDDIESKLPNNEEEEEEFPQQKNLTSGKKLIYSGRG